MKNAAGVMTVPEIQKLKATAGPGAETPGAPNPAVPAPAATPVPAAA
jgi:hypothetical protein